MVAGSYFPEELFQSYMLFWGWQRPHFFTHLWQVTEPGEAQDYLPVELALNT